jgi:signal transduction histidine kinase
LEAVVSASRQRNLTVAILVDLLILAAGGLLVRHTRHSRRLAEAQMSFVAGVSHELRTPLTVIRGAAHNLRRGVVQDPERVARYSDLILQHAEQLGAMVEQVLEFAGAQKNLPSSVREPVSISNVLHDALAAAAPDTEAAHCHVECRIPPSVPPVSGDAAALSRVFQNLVANAAKHGGAGGFIGLTAAFVNGSGPPSIEVQVTDRGPGIPECEQADILKPFVRGAAAQAAQVRGSGLGLSLVSEIVKAHGGTISIRSQPGAGATFTVRLPAAPPSV